MENPLKLIYRSLFSEKKLGCVSFPKSGRTWLRVMLDDLNIDLDYTHAGSSHQEGAHFNELGADLFFRQYKKLVFLYRDPRDTVVSGFHQATKRVSVYEGTISDFIGDPCYGVEKIVRFNLDWLNLARHNRNKVLVVSYEQLQRDTGFQLKRIASFLNQKIEDVAVARVVEENSFQKMQSREKNNEFQKKYGSALRLRDAQDRDSFKVRKGVVGGYMEELSENDITFCNKILANYDYVELTSK